MCAEMGFCRQCENNAVRHWSDGLTHTLPLFGDAAQRAAAINRRAHKLVEMFKEQDEKFRLWPEWAHVTQAANLPLDVSVARLKGLMQPTIVPPGRGASRQRKHKYQIRLRRWNWNIEVENRLKNAVGRHQHPKTAMLSKAA